MNKTFRCRQCGECCRHIGHIPELDNYHNGDGICKYLNPFTNLCTIYENRPVICNVDKAYVSLFINVMTQDEYLEKNYEGCKNLWKMKQLEVQIKEEKK